MFVAATAITAVSVINTVASKSKATTKKKDNKKKNNEKHTVYTLRDPKVVCKDGTKKVEYVGRTKNPEARKNAHKNHPVKRFLVYEKEKDGLSYMGARAVEEYLIMYYGTIEKGNYRKNQIHGINPRDPDYQMYMTAAEALLSDETYVGGYEC